MACRLVLLMFLVSVSVGCNDYRESETNVSGAGDNPSQVDGFQSEGQTLSGSSDGSKDSAGKTDEQAKKQFPGSGKLPMTVRIGGIDWYTDYDVAVKIARLDGKPLWLHFGENPG